MIAATTVFDNGGEFGCIPREVAATRVRSLIAASHGPPHTVKTKSSKAQDRPEFALSLIPDRIKIRECPPQCGAAMAWILPSNSYNRMRVGAEWWEASPYCANNLLRLRARLRNDWMLSGARDTWALLRPFHGSYHKSYSPWKRSVEDPSKKPCRVHSLQATAVRLLPQSACSKGTGFSSRFGRGFYN